MIRATKPKSATAIMTVNNPECSFRHKKDVSNKGPVAGSRVVTVSANQDMGRRFRYNAEGPFVIGHHIDPFHNPAADWVGFVADDDHGVNTAEKRGFDHLDSLAKPAPHIGQHSAWRIRAAHQLNHRSQQLFGEGRGLRVVGEGELDRHRPVVLALGR